MTPGIERFFVSQFQNDRNRRQNASTVQNCLITGLLLSYNVFLASPARGAPPEASENREFEAVCKQFQRAQRAHAVVVRSAKGSISLHSCSVEMGHDCTTA